MYSLELSLRYSPFPLSIQKKELDDVKGIYEEIKNSMSETEEKSNLIELRCDKVLELKKLFLCKYMKNHQWQGELKDQDFL